MISQTSATVHHLTPVSQSIPTTCSSKEDYAFVTPKASSSPENASSRKANEVAAPFSWSLEDSSIEKQYHSWKPLLEPTPLLSEVTVTGAQAFPFRLHEMLDDAELKGFTNVVSWQDGGKSFKIHDRHLFATWILPRYLEGQTKYKSFQRQLNIYNFVRHMKGSNKGAYSHECFIQGKPKMCRFMVRIKIKSKKRGSSSLAAAAIQRCADVLPVSNIFLSSALERSVFKEGSLAQGEPQRNTRDEMKVETVLRSVKTLLETLQRTGPTMNDVDRKRYTEKILELSSSTLKNLASSCPRVDASSAFLFQEEHARTIEHAACALPLSSRQSPCDSTDLLRRESFLKYSGSFSNLMGDSAASIHLGDDLFFDDYGDHFGEDNHLHDQQEGQVDGLFSALWANPTHHFTPDDRSAASSSSLFFS